MSNKSIYVVLGFVIACASQGALLEVLRVPIVSPRQLMRSLLASDQTKDAYESTAAFEKRRASELAALVPNSRVFFNVQAAEFEYNANTEQVTVTTLPFRNARNSINETLPRVIVDFQNDTRDPYIGRTGLGIEVMVEKRYQFNYDLACINEDQSLGGLYADGKVSFTIPMKPDVARRVVETMSMVIEFEVERPIHFIFKCVDSVKPTAQKPIETSFFESSLRGKLRKIILIERNSRTVLAVKGFK